MTWTKIYGVDENLKLKSKLRTGIFIYNEIIEFGFLFTDEWLLRMMIYIITLFWKLPPIMSYKCPVYNRQKTYISIYCNLCVSLLYVSVCLSVTALEASVFPYVLSISHINVRFLVLLQITILLINILILLFIRNLIFWSFLVDFSQ